MAQKKITGVQLDTTTITLSGGALTPSSIAATGTVTGSNLSGTNTGDQTISLTGDVTGSGTGSFAATLATVNSNVGSFGTASSTGTFTVNAKGLITAASNTSIQIAETQITDGALLARVNANETITGNWTFNNVVVGVDPVSASNFTTKQYVDNALLGLTWKAPVLAATTANITLSGAQTIDGVSLVAGNRCLVKNQTSSQNNGIYVVASGAWTRATDFDSITPIDEINGAAVFVTLGTTQGDTGWVETATVVTVGTDPIIFVQFSAAGAYTAGAGLSLSGNTFNVGTASSSRIVVNVDDIDLATVGTAGTYKSVTTDAYGRVTAGTNPTTLAGYGIVDAQPLDATLTSLAAYNTNGLLTQTAADTFVGRTITGTAGNITVSNGNGVSGNPTLDLATVTDAGTGTFLKLTRDSYGRVSGTTAVVAADITALVNATYVNVTGDVMSGPLQLDASTQVTSSGSAGSLQLGFLNSAITSTTDAFVTWAGSSQPLISSFGGANGSLLLAARNISGSAIVMSTGGVNAAMIDSNGNFGIGTTNPQFQFDLQGTGGSPMSLTRFSNTASSTSISLRHSRGAAVGTNTIVQNGDTLGSLIFSGANGTGYDSSSAVRGEVDGTPGASADMPGRLIFLTCADGSATLSERLRIDNAGQIGVGGVVPGSWSASAKALEFSYPTFGMDGAGQAFMGFNLREQTSGNWFYKSTDYGLLFRSGGSSGWLWSTAPSGTVNTAATLTERMRLDQNGMLGLGTTPSAWSTSMRAIDISTGAAIRGTSTGISMECNTYYNGSNFIAKNTGAGGELAVDAGTMYFFNAASVSGGATQTMVERLRVDTSGVLTLGNAGTSNLFLGSASSLGGGATNRAYINMNGTTDSTIYMGASNSAGFYIYNNGASGLTQFVNPGTATMDFYTNGSLRQRITSSGDVLVGRASGGLDNTSGTTIVSGTIQSERSSATSLFLNRSTSDGAVAEFRRQNTPVGTISVTGSATAYNTSSDIRLKENIVDAGPAGLVIDAIQVREFDFKNGDHQRFGFIAQELVVVAPEAVKVGDNALEIVEAWGVDYSKLVPLLVKEIQELRARVALLETK
jgi:hypothetical protein